MNFYSVASDFKAETIDGYERLNRENRDNQVLETYGQYTIANEFEGGRDFDNLAKIDAYDLKNYVEYSLAKGIGFNYVLNSSCMGNHEFTEEGIKKIKKHLLSLYKMKIRDLTVTLPSLIEIIQSLDLDFRIKVSIISQVNSANKAYAYKKMGIKRLVVDEAINRDFVKLKEIVQAFGDSVEVMANSLCHKDCIYRMFHYNQTGHDSVYKPERSIKTFYNHKCMLKRAESVEEWLKLCWIRPEDIPFYNRVGIHHFKLQGRHTVLGGQPVRVVEHYFNQDYDGDLIELLEMFNCPYHLRIKLNNKKLDGFLKKFYDHPDFCRSNCLSCTYCREVAKTCTDYEKMQEVNQLAKTFYAEYDDFGEQLTKRK